MIPKFRFYNIKLNKIYEVVGIDFFNEQVDCLLPELNNDISFWDFNVGILMQSTGLFDKNGTEIFEGDVVKIDNHPLQVHKAPFSGISIGININGNYVVEYSTEDMAYFIGNWKTREVIRHSEVIGNKFENPELLREE